MLTRFLHLYESVTEQQAIQNFNFIFQILSFKRKNNNGYNNIYNMAGKRYWFMKLDVVLKQLEIFKVLWSRDL